MTITAYRFMFEAVSTHNYLDTPRIHMFITDVSP
jgi:hypothetical protein